MNIGIGEDDDDTDDGNESPPPAAAAEGGNESPAEPLDQNRNIFRVLFYHNPENNFYDKLKDFGRFPFDGIPQLQIKHSSVLLKIGNTDVRGRRKNEMPLEQENGRLCDWLLADLPFDVSISFHNIFWGDI